MKVKVGRDVVVIGGSAGALDPLKDIVMDLPPDTQAAVVVVLHLSATAPSALATILGRLGGMQVVTPRDGDPLQPGYVYVAVPDRHLELRDGAIGLTLGPRVNGMRPAVDTLFRSAAATYGPRVVGIVLSGGLDDGSGGLAAIRAAGGVGIVQSPDDALMDSMPKNAISVAAPEHVVPSQRLGETIRRVLAEGGSKKERSIGGIEMELVGANDTDGQVTGLTCPDCHGSIWLQKDAGGAVAFTCRVGHSYSPETFFELQAENIENALWAGVRSLEEQSSLAAVMGARAGKLDDRQAVERYEQRRRRAARNAETLRKLLVDRPDA
jgi:two-component system, chemotaxis family, protein-glutamate methylesterase/glutaminase